jgi:hypothetical protein
VPQQAVQDALVLRLDDGSSSPASIKVGCLISGARGNVEVPSDAHQQEQRRACSFGPHADA